MLPILKAVTFIAACGMVGSVTLWFLADLVRISLCTPSRSCSALPDADLAGLALGLGIGLVVLLRPRRK